MNPTALEPRRHAPPPGWSTGVFEAVTSAIAAALVAAYRRAEHADTESAPAAPETLGQ